MGGKLKNVARVVLICGGSDCKAKGGGKKLEKKAVEFVRDLGLGDSTHIVRTECNGFCDDAPVAALEPGNLWLRKTTSKALRKAICKEFKKEAG